MPSIADLFISVSADVGGAITGLTDVDNKVNGTSQAMAAAAPAGFALAGAATAVGAAFLDSISTAQSFEKQMSGVQAVLSPDQINTYGAALHDLALKLGAETSFSASQAAGAIEELVKAGIPVETVLNGGAAAALNLAAATGTDVKEAATIASNAMNTYHLSADQLTGTMDQLTKVSNASAADMHELGFAMQALGPTGASLGLTFNDLNETLGIFANNGLKGSDAGTSLKTMLLNLEPASKAQVDAFKQLGLYTIDTNQGMLILAQTLEAQGTPGIQALTKASKDGTVTFDELFNAAKNLNPQLVGGADNSLAWARNMGLTSNAFFDASGQAKSMGEIFGILQTATANLTQEQKVNLLQTAFGTDAVRAALIAANEGTDGWNKMSAAIAGSADAQTSAATRLGNLSGSMEQLNGSLEVVKINIGERFLPVLTQLVNFLTQVVNAFATLDPNIQTAIVAAVAITGVLAGVTAAGVLLTPVIVSVGTAFGILAAVAAPVLVTLAALAAAGALLYEAWQTDFGGIREVAQQAFEAIQPGIVNIQNFVQQLSSALAPAFQNVATTAGPFIEIMSQLAGQVLQQIPPLIRLIGDDFNFVSGVIQNAIAIFQQFATAVGLEDKLNAVGNALNIVRAAMDLLVTGSFKSLFDFLVAAGPEAEGFAHFILGVHDAVYVTIFAIQTLVDNLNQLLGNLGDVFGPLVQQAWDVGPRLADAFTNFLSFIGQALQSIPEIIATIGDVWEPFITAAWEIAPRIGDAFGNFLGYIGEALAGIPTMISGLGDLFGPLVDAAWGIGSRIGDAVVNVLGFLGEQFGGIPTLLTGLGDIFGPIIQAAEALVGRLADAIGPIRDLLQNTFGSFWNFLTGSITLPTAPTGGGTTGGTGTLPSTGTGGPLVYVANVNASNVDEANAFLALVAQAVLASAQRVTPPVAGGNPALA